MAEKNGAALRKVLRDLQLEKIQEEQYPSVTVMNRWSVRWRHRIRSRPTSLRCLRRCGRSRYPSIPMINGIEGLLNTLG